MPAHGPATLGCLLALAAAGPGEPRRLETGDIPAGLQSAVARAQEAIRAAACDVERRFGEGDPVANAASCEGASAVTNVEVGRTSARLRSPRNTAPVWARPYLLATEGRKAADVPGAVFDLGDAVGLLRPIEIRRRCLACHAPRSELSEGTRSWLARAYPRDRAVGYHLGDLRGFWWAEAPGRPGKAGAGK